MLKRLVLVNNHLNHLVDQNTTPNTLGKDSNALVWPRGPPDDDAEEELDNYKNERFLRLGMRSLFPVHRL